MKKLLSILLMLPAFGFCQKTIPGRIEAENFSTASYGVFSAPTNDVGGGNQLVGIITGSIMDYNVNVVATGTYKVSFRIATTQNPVIELRVGNVRLTSISVTSTGDWNTWNTVTAFVSLTAGPQTIRVVSTGSFNFNWFEVTPDIVVPPPLPVVQLHDTVFVDQRIASALSFNMDSVVITTATTNGFYTPDTLSSPFGVPRMYQLVLIGISGANYIIGIKKITIINKGSYLIISDVDDQSFFYAGWSVGIINSLVVVQIRSVPNVTKWTLQRSIYAY